MNASTLKILVPLGLLVAVVFAVTYFSQYTPTDPDQELKEQGPDAGAAPLRFFSSTRRWDPRPVGDDGVNPPPLMDRAFPGFYEENGAANPASFWFENPGDRPVTMQLEKVSCNSCSGGSLATIPPDLTRQLLQMTAVSVLPQGGLPLLPVGLAGPAAAMDDGQKQLAWQSYSFKDTPFDQVVFTVPAADAGDKWAPRWGILKLTFQAKKGARVPLEATFKTRVQGAETFVPERFAIFYQPVPPFEVDTTVIDVGELTEASAPVTRDVTVFSVTRPPAELPTPATDVTLPPGAEGEPGGFVTAGSPAPLPAADLKALAEKLGLPVRSAVRIPVTVKVQDGNTRLDIGELRRVVGIAVGSEARQVQVRGVMRGPVYLSEGKEIDLGTFRTADGTTETRNVTTERPGVELAVARGRTRPDYLDVTLTRLPDRAGRGYYAVRVHVPPGKQEGEIRDGVVDLEIKGDVTQHLRLPVKGRGRR